MKIYLENKKIKFIQNTPKILSKKKVFTLSDNLFISRWPFFSSTSCLSVERKYFNEFLKYNTRHYFNYPNVWLDFRLCAYSFFKRRNFISIDKPLTNYDQSKNSNQSDLYNRFRQNWINRRYHSHKYVNNFNKIKFIISIDYIFTKLIYKILYIKIR